MINLKAKVNISEFGFFRIFAASRTRLILVNLVGFFLLYSISYFAANYILATSTSVFLNIFFIAAAMMFVMILAYLQAILLGEFFFSTQWRERIILGNKDISATVKDHNAEFLIIVFVMILLNSFALNIVTDHFFSTYQEEGFFRARLRSNDPEERKSALVKLGEVTSFKLWENENLRQIVREHFHDPNTIVREQAAWNAGEMGDTSARKELFELVKSDSNSMVRAEAAIAIGKLGNQTEMREALESELGKENPTAVKVGVLTGLALMRSPLSGKSAWELTRDPDETLSQYAYWVLRN